MKKKTVENKKQDDGLMEVTVKSNIDLSSIMSDGKDPGEVKVLTTITEDNE